MFKNFLIILFILPFCALGQSINQKLEQAYQQLSQNPQSKNALISIYIADANTGKPIFTKNENIGIATASTLKTITSASTYYLLGEDFRYKTELSYSGKINNGILYGNLIITGFGDPTLGSSRYEKTKSKKLLSHWALAVKNAGISKVEGRIVIDDLAFGTATIPNGWIWQDIGNYYGAGGAAICWDENQLDLKLLPGKNIGDSVNVIKSATTSPDLKIINELKTGKAGTGDKAYAYLAPYTNICYLRGTWAIDIKKTGIAIANPDPAYELALSLNEELQKNKIICSQMPTTSRLLSIDNNKIESISTTIDEVQSPNLNEIIYWFNKKSINLYGEQLLKTIAWKQGKESTTENGIKIIKEFWEKKGIDKTAINMIDGSGLSPANRVSTSAMAAILYQVQNEKWFDNYLKSFPEYNNMTLKSGHINDVAAYAGYYTSPRNNKYIIVININNYNGNSISNKLFKVLDVLKSF